MTVVSPFTGAPIGFHTGGFSTQGWFVGGGVENNLDIFGISAPGWFMKTEYRAAYYDNKNVNILVDGTNAPTGFNVNFKPLVADGQHLAGLSLQLDRSGRREVLIFRHDLEQKPRHRPGLFCALALVLAQEIVAAIGDTVPCSCARRSRAPLWQPLRRLPRAKLIKGKPMRKLLLVVGFLALAIGLLWIGQGTGAIKWPQSSFMISQIQWAGYGVALAAFGLILIWQGKP